ncbi:hypothetical protein P3T25_007163 [Paraburkholderia sp. GAS32]
MLGFKRFRSAATTISCIELMHRICKGQYLRQNPCIVLQPILLSKIAIMFHANRH